MTRRPRVLIAGIAMTIVVIAVVSWVVDQRTRPDVVGPRLVDRLKARHPDATIRAVGPAMLEVTPSSGLPIELRLAAVFDACRADRIGCRAIVDRAVDDVDRAQAAASAPTRAALRPMAVADTPGYRYGFVTEPVIGSLELRYVLVNGFAATFVTSTIQDRLGLSGAALKAAALENMRSDSGVDLVRIDGATEPALYRVRADGDPVASLVDRARMERFAKTLQTRRLDVFVPARGVLYLAAASAPAAKALDALRVRMPGFEGLAIGLGVMLYDTDAPADQALTMASGLR